MNKNKDTDMADDDQEEKLPEVLEKLEIVPLMPTIKLRDDNLPLLLNPFYFQENYNKNMESIKLSESQIESKLFGTKCKCMTRKNHNNIQHSIINQTRFKHKRNTNSNRIYLKESLLKSIQNCCIHYDHKNSIKGPMNTTNLELSDYPTLEDLRLEDNCLRTTKTTATTNNRQISLKIGGELEKNFLNLRIFIKDCDLIPSSLYLRNAHNLSSSSTSPSTSRSLTRKLKNFTTLQSSDDRIVKNKRKSQNDNDDETNVSTNIVQNNISSNNNNNVSSSSSSSSSSCSQQARNNSSSAATTVSCDITIDELACYFETFVHIPKKMSSMAEMMYI